MDDLVYIKCPKCGRVYRGKSNGYNDIDREIRCSCGEEIKIIFSGICTSCDKKVGFIVDSSWGEIASYMIKSFIKGYIMPTSTIEAFSRQFKYPRAKYASCPFCQRLYLFCPECKTSVHIRKDQESEVVSCPNCGCNMVSR